MGVNESAFGRTADEVYCDIYQKLETFGKNVFGRNGQTKELTHVCMSIADPTQRWVERRKPAISPAFAIAELVMIMNGNDEAALLNAWNPALPKYQGKYDRYPGSYGNNECSIDIEKKTHVNTEKIGLEKIESEKVFWELLVRMRELSQKGCTSNYIKSIVENKYLPEAYQNMLILLCEYIAYSHHMDKEVIYCCEQNISNKLYQYMMKEWMCGRVKL